MTDVIGEHTIKANIIGGGTPISANVIKNKQKIVSQIQTYQQATTTTKGILRLATVEETLEGVDNATAITPLTLNEKFMDVSYYAGDGIRIINRIISVNDDVIASKEFVNDTLSNQITILDDKIDSLTGALSDSIEGIDSIIGGYGDIVTYNASDFATSIQGGLADTALQPNDNISELTNDVGYITSASLPIVNNGILTIQKNGSDVAVFSANQSGNQTANIIVPTDTSDLTNNAGYTTNIGTVTSVNDVSPDSEGNVTLSIPAAQVNSDWNASSGVAEILNKPNLATVATTGSYTDLSNKPTINDLTTTAQQNALNSGATTTNIGQITTNTNDISTINGKIPLAASTSNQLADKSYVDTADSGLQSQINDLKARGRFLALWNCATGLAETNPPQSPYTYQAGDYFIVGTVSTATPTVNYKPTGSSYTTGVASTVVETDVVDIDDVYYYDGTNWKLQINTQKTVSFVNIAGSPYDNTNLSTALNAKADTSSLATVATSGSYNDLTNTPTIPTDTNDLTNGAGFITGINNTDVTTALGYIPYDSTNPDGFISGINSTDVTTALGYTPVNPSSLATVATSGDYDDLTNKPTIPTNYVTTDTAQDITGRKTFLGEKAIYFKQSASTNKLGFTLYNTSSSEIGAFEYRPNTISGGALLNVNCSYSSTSYVGFRYWGTAVNIIAPKVATAGDYYIPVNITDGINTVTANNTGTVNISSLLPDLSNYVTSSTLTTTLADYVLSSSLATVATSGSYNDLSNKPTIPTVNDGTITINQGGTQKGTFTLNQSGNTTIDLDAGGGGGSTYTAGNFIDITSDVISVDLDGTGTLPTLSSDGTMGGDSYACSATSAYTGWNAYRAFDGDLETNWSPYGQMTASLYYYTPKSVKATNVKITFAEDEAFRGVKILGSNDGSSYTQLATYDNSASDTIINIPVTTSIAYKYYQIYFDVIPSGSNWGAVLNIELSIDATILTDKNISSTNVTDALGYIPYNSSNPDGYLANKSTGTESLAIGNITNSQNQNTVIGIDATSTQAWNTVIGRHSQCTGSSCILLGDGLSVSGTVNVCIGDSASTSGNNTIQLGAGTNNTSNTFNVGFGSSVGNYTLLDGTTGLIPDARINKQTSISSSSTDAQIPSAKCVYDNVKNTVIQTTTSTSTLYAWYNSSATPDTIYTTTTTINSSPACFDSNNNFLWDGYILVSGKIVANSNEYTRTSASDLTFTRQTLKDYSGNAINTVQGDGQWVNSTTTLSTATAINTYTLSLADYLPDDNYDYLVHIQVKGYLSASGKSAQQYISSDIYTIDEAVCEPSGSYTRTWISNIYIPVGSSRSLTYQIAGNALNTAHVTAFGYRRIGTNK